jgi:DNA-binding NtrC family response regulator
MTRIRVAQGVQWTEALATILAAAGHQVTTESPQIAFVDAGDVAEGVGELTIVVATPQQLSQAIERVKGGAYAFVRHPFIAEEVTLLVDRAIEHQALLQEHRSFAGRIDAPVGATAGNGDVAAARNLAGKPLADIEKQVILSTLEQFKGHRVKTATALGIGVRTLGMKLKKWRDEGEPIIGRHGVRQMQTSS